MGNSDIAFGRSTSVSAIDRCQAEQPVIAAGHTTKPSEPAHTCRAQEPRAKVRRTVHTTDDGSAGRQQSQQTVLDDVFRETLTRASAYSWAAVSTPASTPVELGPLKSPIGTAAAAAAAA